MCVLTSVLFVFSACSFLPVLQVVAKNRRTQRDSLQLTTRIMGQQYCRGQLRMALQLKYTNIGNQTLILFKESTAVSQALVSLNLEDAKAERYEQDLQFTNNVISEERLRVDKVPGPDFVTLDPGSSFVADSKVIIFTAEATIGSHGLTSGRYMLQLKVQTWYETEKLASQLRKSWKKTGVLWTADVTSMPMPFIVEIPQKAVYCSAL
jgi:hypothetical protein